MTLFICAVLLLLLAAGIVLLSCFMRGRAHKAGFIIGIVILGNLALAALGYLALGALVVNSIP